MGRTKRGHLFLPSRSTSPPTTKSTSPRAVCTSERPSKNWLRLRNSPKPRDASRLSRRTNPRRPRSQQRRPPKRLKSPQPRRAPRRQPRNPQPKKPSRQRRPQPRKPKLPKRPPARSLQQKNPQQRNQQQRRVRKRPPRKQHLRKNKHYLILLYNLM